MMNTKSILTYSLGSLLSLALAGGLWFLGSRLIGDVPEAPVAAEDIIVDCVSEVPSEPEEPDTPVPVEPEYNVSLAIKGPDFNVRYRNYEVRPEAAFEGCDAPCFEYLVYDDQNNLVKTETRNVFALNATNSGKYYLVARETTTGKESDALAVTGCTIRKMSKARLEQICNSGDYSTITKGEAYDFADDYTMTFNPAGVYASSIADICTKISLDIWKSVKVSNIVYDNLGRIKQIKFDVVK